jgi:transcription initiation factor TFIID subunit 6
MADPKLVWNPDNVRDVAESVGISALSEEAIRALSQEVEYRVGQVIVEAMRFMQQGKRVVLGTQDISQALKVLDVEPLYGYESTRPLRFGEASLGPGQPLFYIEDEEVDFEKLINAPLPKVPRDISFTGSYISLGLDISKNSWLTRYSPLACSRRRTAINTTESYHRRGPGSRARPQGTRC